MEGTSATSWALHHGNWLDAKIVLKLSLFLQAAPMTSAVSETVRCMGRHESKGGKAPAAVKSCLACQKHFCAQCDAGAHPAGTNHHRFVIGALALVLLVLVEAEMRSDIDVSVLSCAAGMRSHIDFSTPIKVPSTLLSCAQAPH